MAGAHIGKYKDNKAFITFEQTIQHEDYIMYIFQTLKNSGIDLYDIKYYSIRDFRYGSINKYTYLKTHSSELLYPLANMFLSHDNRKILPFYIKYHLSSITSAFWICDDDQLVNNGGIALCIDNYTLAEVELLIKVLSNRYDAKCYIHHKIG